MTMSVMITIVIIMLVINKNNDDGYNYIDSSNYNNFRNDNTDKCN